MRPLLVLLALASARMGGKRRPRAALPTLNATEQQRVFERATDAVHVAGAEPFGCPGDAFNVSVVHLLRDAPRLERFVGAIRNASYDVRFEVWPGFVQGRKRVIQVRFNLSVPRARVPETAPTLRERSER